MELLSACNVIDTGVKRWRNMLRRGLGARLARILAQVQEGAGGPRCLSLGNPGARRLRAVTLPIPLEDREVLTDQDCALGDEQRTDIGLTLRKGGCFVELMFLLGESYAVTCVELAPPLPDQCHISIEWRPASIL
jgi:hypothetical protein